MAHNKNQHFVPRAVFRPFTHQNEGKSICLLNISSSDAKPLAAVSGQCSKSYFYGKDKIVDDTIWQFEAKYAGVRDELLREGAKSLSEGDLFFLRRFVLLQNVRTLRHFKEAEHVIKQLHQASVHKFGMLADEMLNKEQIMNIILSSYADSSHLVDDLKICFLVNETSRDFLLSDNPAIHVNRLYAQRLKQGNFGLGNAGCIFLMPIGPHVAVMVYDSGTYYIDGASKVEKHLRDLRDVNWFNELQCQLADHNVYFQKWQAKDYVHDIAGNVADVRQGIETMSFLNTATLAEQTPTHKKYTYCDIDDIPDNEGVLLHTSANHAAPPTWPKFLRFRSLPKFIDTRSGAGIVRRATY